MTRRDCLTHPPVVKAVPREDGVLNECTLCDVAHDHVVTFFVESPADTGPFTDVTQVLHNDPRVDAPTWDMPVCVKHLHEMLTLLVCCTCGTKHYAVDMAYDGSPDYVWCRECKEETDHPQRSYVYDGVATKFLIEVHMKARFGKEEEPHIQPEAYDLEERIVYAGTLAELRHRAEAHDPEARSFLDMEYGSGIVKKEK
jgi:hypothetical protein